jgi:DNA mismatch repair protein MutL
LCRPFDRRCLVTANPLAFIHLAVAPHHIDWNRRPDKGTLYLHQLDQWIALCQNHLELLLGQQATPLADQGQQRLTQLIKTSEPGGAYGLTPELSDQLPPSDSPRQPAGAGPGSQPLYFGRATRRTLPD